MPTTTTTVIKNTRYLHLGYAERSAGRWVFVDTCRNCPVGSPVYPSRAALLRAAPAIAFRHGYC